MTSAMKSSATSTDALSRGGLGNAGSGLWSLAAPLGGALATAVYVFGVAGGRPGAGTVMLVGGGAAFGWATLTLWRLLLPLADPELVGTPAAVRSSKRRRELEREKFVVLKALKELEFDRDMGKISAADFDSIGARFRTRARRLMQALDTEPQDVRTVIERELKTRMATRRGDHQAPAAPLLEAAGPRACPGCSSENDHDAVFCKRCGTKISSV